MGSQQQDRTLVTATVAEGKLLLRGLGLKTGDWEEMGEYLLWRPSGEGEAPFSLVVTGIGPERAEAGLRSRLDAEPSTRVVVGFGFAGGLAKSGKRGELVIPTDVRWEGKQEMPTEWLRMSLAANGSGEIWRRLITVTEVVSSRPEKAALYAATDAEAVDMESGVWGKVCRERKIPWAIVRTILDPADESLPSELSETVDEFGRSSVSKSIPLFLRHPSLIGPAFKMAGGTLSKAMMPMSKLLDAWLEAER